MSSRDGGGWSLALAKDSAYVAMGRYSGLLVALITTPLYARALGLDGMAQLAVAVGSGFVGSLAVDLGLTSPLAARVATGDPQVGALRSAYAKNRAYVGLALVLTWALAITIAPSSNVTLIASGALVGAASSVGEDWLLIGRRRYKALAASQLTARAVLLILSGALAFLGALSVPSILVLAGVTNALGGAITWRLAASDPARLSATPDMRAELARLSLSYATSRALSVTQAQAPTFFWGHVALPGVFGVFAGADKVFRATQSLTDALSIALLPRVSRSKEGQRARYQAIGASLAVGTVLAVLVAAVASPAVAVLLGREFEASVTPLRILACALPGASLFGTVTGSVLIGLGRARLVVAANLMGALAALAALFVVGGDASPEEMAWSVVCAYSASGLMSVLMAVRAMKREVAEVAATPDGERAIVAYLDHTGEPGGAELALRRSLEQGPNWPWVLFVPTGATEVWRGLPQGSVITTGPRQEVGAATSRGLRAQFGFGLALLGMAHALRKNTSFRAAGAVHANTARSAIYGALAVRRGQLLIVHLRDAATAESLGRTGWIAMRFIALRRADGIVANSSFVMNTIEPYVAEAKPRRVIPSPISPPVPSSRSLAQESGTVRIAMLGRLADWKGIDLAIQAVAEMSLRDRVELVIVGGSTLVSEPIEDQLRALAMSLGIAERVCFARHVPPGEVPSLIAGFDIGLQYSRRAEPMGQNVLQYLAAGLTVVAADEGGPREWVTNGVNGLLVEPRSPRTLAGVLDQLVQDPGLRAQLSRAASATTGLPHAGHVNATLSEFYVSLAPRRKGLW